VSFPPHLLDELARVFARVALDRLLKQSVARKPRPEGESGESEYDLQLPTDHPVDDGDVEG
jgi:hypothetical protein